MTASDVPPKTTQVLTSSFVVRLEAIKYVWKPESPRMDQMEKKQITSSTTVHKESRFVTFKQRDAAVMHKMSKLLPSFL